MEKRKVYGTILGISLFALVILGLTYAILQWTSSNSDNTNIRLTVNKDIANYIVYVQGNSILSTDDKELAPSEDYSGGISTTIEFYKQNTTKPIYGTIYMEILNMLSSSNTTDANIKKTDTLKWAITTYTSSNTTEVLVGEGNFKDRNIDDKFAIYQNFELSTTRTYFKIYIWYDINAIDESLPLTNELLSVEISAEATDTLAASYVTLTNLGLTSNGVKDSFAEVVTTDEGVFEAEDDLGTSYYFRGAATNNYVYFAGFYWRIIRINGDGTVRMIYDGTEAHANGESSSNRYMGTTAYNSSYNDNAYVGYMYGSVEASTYEDTHANTNDSTIKTYLDSWYKTNIVDAGYSSYVVDAIYCNDRQVNSGTGIGTTTTYYKAYNRLHTNKTPTLECSGANDKFTVSETLGNGDLTYPIGLITADEIAMAGGTSSNTNSSYYLYMGSYYWTMSPDYFNGSASPFGVGGTGCLVNLGVNSSGGGRGVISIDGSALNAGSGTATDPFRISISSEQTLTNLGLTSNGTKNSFAEVATTDEGVFEAEDDLGTSYYFRGAVENNYVKFAGYYWRIIRINGDGSIRMIYDGTSAHEYDDDTTPEDRQIGTSAYNTNYGDNAYVGYMYGTAGSSTYEATHANTNNSTIKTVVDSWYKTNIVDKGYSPYVADAIYCNDREVDSGTGIGTTTTYYKAYNRLYTNKTPTLKCGQANDKFTVSSSLGNGALEYPIGLITTDEVAMAGGVFLLGNSNYYLNNGLYYHTMTPGGGTSSGYYLLNVSPAGYLGFADANGNFGFLGLSLGIRPVISVLPSTIQYGNGTSTDPYRLTSAI